MLRGPNLLQVQAPQHAILLHPGVAHAAGMLAAARIEAQLRRQQECFPQSSNEPCWHCSKVAADPLLQWRWPPLRQGIGRRWSLKVLERFSAHWHWLPMALSRPLLASLGSRASFEPTCHLPPTIATVSTDPSLQRLRSVLTVGLTATCRRPQRARRWR